MSKYVESHSGVPFEIQIKPRSGARRAMAGFIFALYLDSVKIAERWMFRNDISSGLECKVSSADARFSKLEWVAQSLKFAPIEIGSFCPFSKGFQLRLFTHTNSPWQDTSAVY